MDNLTLFGMMKQKVLECRDEYAVHLYFYLIHKADIDGTNQVYATCVYIHDKLGWSESTFTRAKKVLRDLGAIEMLHKSDGRTYIRINYYMPMGSYQTARHKRNYNRIFKDRGSLCRLPY